MIKNPKTDSALHVLKGAVEKVLGASLTTSVYEEGNKGRLTVEFDRNPTKEEIFEIEKLANEKIQENIEIKHFDMNRKEAEEKYGNKIYDKFPVPLHITTLKILEIPHWNINCCIGEHTKTTGEIGNVSIRKYRFRESKQQLEIGFELALFP
ncbi:MAG: alanyl-tRNA editing protein [Nanoarchaeota archaeon]|nr:alanyl-tRNA editing protein [Nanoarchaeota archaeon]